MIGVFSGGQLKLLWKVCNQTKCKQTPIVVTSKIIYNDTVQGDYVETRAQ